MDFNYYSSNATFRGKDIDDIHTSTKMKLTFDIDFETRHWGLKDVSLYNIKGPEYVQCEVIYYLDAEHDDQQSETVNIKLDWEKLETEERTGEGVVTIGDSIEIDIVNGENGELVAGEMLIEIFTL